MDRKLKGQRGHVWVWFFILRTNGKSHCPSDELRTRNVGLMKHRSVILCRVLVRERLTFPDLSVRGEFKLTGEVGGVVT